MFDFATGMIFGSSMACSSSSIGGDDMALSVRAKYRRKERKRARRQAAKENERLRVRRFRENIELAITDPKALAYKEDRLQYYIDMQTAYMKRMEEEEQDG